MLEDLRNALHQFVNGEMDLAAFEDWVVSHLQIILDSHDQKSIEIVSALDVLLIDLGEGLITEREFFHEAKAFLPPPTIVVAGPVALNTSNTTVQSDSFTSGVHPVWSLAT